MSPRGPKFRKKRAWQAGGWGTGPSLQEEPPRGEGSWGQEMWHGAVRGGDRSGLEETFNGVRNSPAVAWTVPPQCGHGLLTSLGMWDP